VISDTNGLSALAEGDPGLESVLRKASQLAIPVIVIGEYRYGISQSRHRTDYEEWLAEYLPRFGFSMSMSGLRSTIAWCAASLEKLARRFLPMMFGSQPYAAGIVCLSSAATATSVRFLVSQESVGDRTFYRPTVMLS
jgi:predicted nucleic acid-binding protein